MSIEPQNNKLKYDKNYPEIKEKLDRLLRFLADNHTHAQQLLDGYRLEAMLPVKDESPEEKVFACLHGALFSQSQANLDNVAKLLNGIYGDLNGSGKSSAIAFEAFSSMASFCQWVSKNPDSKTTFSIAWEELSKQPAFGVKTAALFLKNVYRIHHEPHLADFDFWDDVPKIGEDDFLPIPVDRVILHVFNGYIPKIRTSSDKERNWTFLRINEVLKYHTGNNLIIWDDLWYWGYITQRVENTTDEERSGGAKKKKRTLSFNEGKYWTWRYAPKDIKTRNLIRQKAKEFIDILES